MRTYAELLLWLSVPTAVYCLPENFSEVLYRGQYRFAALILNESQGICSGSIISLTTVLTIRECESKNMTASAGHSKQQKKNDIQVKKLQRCVTPGRNETQMPMVCFTESAWNWTECVYYTPLYMEQLEMYISEELADIIGFGKYSMDNESDRMGRVASRWLVGSAECASLMKDSVDKAKYICSKPKGGMHACLGDGGGPVFGEFQGQYAVSVTLQKEEPPCGIGEMAEPYVFVGHYRKWIRHTVRDLPSNGSLLLCGVSVLLLYGTMCVVLYTKYKASDY